MSRNPIRTASLSVTADMSARALLCASRLALASTALVAVATSSILLSGNDITCSKDGLHADFDTECQEYVRCSSGIVRGRYACPAGRVFSDVAGACVPRRSYPCAQRICAAGDTLAYATPGTACRHYYRCENGTAVDHACPSGSWFDLARQACSRGAGTCYEPVCAGLPDGKYPDSSHECRRTLQCRGAELRAVVSCVGTCVSTCPPPRSTAVPLPAGDADFCSDEACSSLCQHTPDGAYADRSAGCREYFVCESHRVIRRGVCEPGLLFSGSGCESAAGTYCPPPGRSPCFNRQDGLYRDWRDCSSWFECRRERVTARGACELGFVFDGVGCVPRKSYYCEGPDPAAECEGMPSGTYQDLESNCTRYFHCEGTLRTSLACPVGQVFDGARCMPAFQYLCPSLDRDSCYGRADGRYRAVDAGCRGFYACINGEKAVYACPSGRVFDGEMCVPTHPAVCPREDYTCSGLSDGYHAELKSNCHRYFYCEGGDKLATLSCLAGKIFDGHACVEPLRHICGAPRRAIVEHGGRYCERDGFFVQQGTECKHYYFCVSGVRTFLTCPPKQVFNGQVCVLKDQYTCPG
ncbi:cell death abnormality protein 1-like [Maniola hyperantus]|uniref:cell death abnormality protein 1-like n=1 Tax=Aphantopus hyperantus TaxID=2795564 RepID=UPI003749FB6F